MKPLVCGHCGAPLPPLPPNSERAVCVYCGGSSAPANVSHDPTLPLRVIETYKARLAAGDAPFDAIRAASRERLGPMGEADTFARVCLALAREFDEAHGTHVVDDPMCISRMIEIYLRAIEALRAKGSFEAHLPFFTATEKGPIDFRRKLDAAEIARLAAKDVAPKRRKLWPFG